jgi:hypothetical protein
VKATDKPFGSVLAYTFPPLYPESFRKERLLDILKTAVRSLGFDRGFFMADYVLREGFPVLIELTPRPGGDSIPDLVRRSQQAATPWGSTWILSPAPLSLLKPSPCALNPMQASTSLPPRRAKSWSWTDQGSKPFPMSGSSFSRRPRGIGSFFLLKTTTTGSSGIAS